MTHIAKHTFALVLAVFITAATLQETTRVPAQPALIA
jgi:hypothetical protein